MKEPFDLNAPKSLGKFSLFDDLLELMDLFPKKNKQIKIKFYCRAQIRFPIRLKNLG